MEISEKVLAIGPATSIEINESVYRLKSEGLDPITLSYGEAPFKFDGSLNFENTDFNEGAHYSDSRGVLHFREKLSDYYFTEYKVKLSVDDFMVTAGSKIGSYIALQTMLNDGDGILLHEPSWVSYQEHAKLSNSSITFMPYSAEVKDFENYFDSNTKVLILNNPNNPRGLLYTEQEIRDCASMCKKHNAYLLVDESYSDFIGDDSFFSVASLIHEFDNVVALNSISKNFGLSGWRIGYLISNQSFLNYAGRLNRHLITCAPTILQNFLAANFDQLLAATRGQLLDLMRKRKDVKKLLDRLGIKYLSGDSTFYFFLDVKDYNIEAKSFCLDLLKNENVAIIPGNAYGNNLKDFLRISFGVESLDRIEIGMLKMLHKLKTTY
jgi:aspartate aminotransferase/aminotransferase